MRRSSSLDICLKPVQWLTIPDVPVPTQFGLPYEDVQISTPDHVKLHAYAILARYHASGTSGSELQRLSHEERRKRMDEEMEKWTEEMGKEDVLEYVKGRPTVVIFHANAGESASVLLVSFAPTAAGELCANEQLTPNREHGAQTSAGEKIQCRIWM